MTENAVLWLFGVLIGALFALIGTLGKIFWAKLSAIDSGALAAFVARDQEREKAWWEWRKSLDEDRKARHQELTDRLNAHSLEIKEIQRKVARMNGQ